MIELIDPSTVELVHFPLPCLWFNVQCGCIGCYEQNYQVMRLKVCSNQTLKFFQTMWRDKTVWPLLVHPNSKVSSEGGGIIAIRLAVTDSLDMPSNCWFPPRTSWWSRCSWPCFEAWLCGMADALWKGPCQQSGELQERCPPRQWPFKNTSTDSPLERCHVWISGWFWFEGFTSKYIYIYIGIYICFSEIFL